MKWSAVRAISLNIASIFIGLCIAVLFGEVMLRVLPIPGVYYNVARFDPLVGSGLYPGATLTYRNDRGEPVNRAINSFGDADKEFELIGDRAKSLYNIGFFGDSYTEARQTPLQNTYFRLVEAKLSGNDVETKSFGISGFSTHQSYLTYKRWAEQFSFDLVVYVFVENDLGDQIREIKKSSSIPYPILDNGSLISDNSFREQNQTKASFIYGLGDYLTAHSLVLATIASRMRLLADYGIKPSLTEEERLMATTSDSGSDGQQFPNVNDVPSSWPDELRDHAKALGKAVILEWTKAARDHSAEFAILYIPRESELSKPVEKQDSWKKWLSELCAEHEIHFIDPSLELIKMQADDKEVYYDHFTAFGHIAVAESFVTWFVKQSDQ